MVAQVLKHQWVTTLVPLRKGAKPAEIFGLIFLVLVSLFLGGNYFAYVWAAGQLAIDPRGASTAVAGASLIVFWITVPVLFGAQPPTQIHRDMRSFRGGRGNSCPLSLSSGY